MSISLPDKIYNGLKARILNHDLYPAASIVIDEISGDFNASAIPVREALVRLCSEGLVVQRNRQGFTVRPITPKIIEDDYRTLASILQVGAAEFVDVITREPVCEPRLAESMRMLAAMTTSETVANLDGLLLEWLPSKRLAAVGLSCHLHIKYFIDLDIELRGKDGRRNYTRRRQRGATALLDGRAALVRKLIAQERDWRIENIPLVIKEMLYRQLVS